MNMSFNPTFALDLELDGYCADPERALRPVLNRFRRRNKARSGRLRNRMRTNIRISLPFPDLMAVASSRGCTTTELLAALVLKAQAAALNDDLFMKHSLAGVAVPASPCKLGQFRSVSVAPGEYSLEDSLACLSHPEKMRRKLVPGTRNCVTLCNLGEIYLSSCLESDVKSVDFRICSQAGMSGAITVFNFRGRTIINCSRKVREHRFEQYFFDELRALGLNASIETSPASEMTFSYSAL